MSNVRIYHSDDPDRDFDRYDEDYAKWLSELPVCQICGERIQDDSAFCINDEWFHRNCLEKEALKAIF